MKKKTLWKDIKECFSKSKGRFFSIMCLVALGSFALVGLQVAGPNMRITGENYFKSLNLTDMSIIGDYGIDEENVKVINSLSGCEKIEYGYLKDVVIENTQTSIRFFSQTEEISQYELVSGRMPQSEDEIALASFYSDEYSLGDTINFTEKEDISGSTVLKSHSFKIVGFVNSSELLSIINMGQSTAGTGELNGYAVVDESAFDSDVYMIARITFNDTKGVDPYSDEYKNLISAHKEELTTLLADQPSERLKAIQEEYGKKIDDAQSQIDEAKSELAQALQTLENGESELAQARDKYSSGIKEYNQKKQEAEEQLESAKEQIESGKTQISEAQAQIDEKSKELSETESELSAARTKLDAGWKEYNEKLSELEELKKAKEELDAAQAEIDPQIEAAEAQMGMTIDEIEENLPALEETLPKEQYEALYALVNANNALKEKWEEYNEKVQAAQGAQEELDKAKAQLEAKEEEYATKKKEFDEAKEQFETAQNELNEKKSELENAENTYNEQKKKAEDELSAAKQTLDEAQNKIVSAQSELTSGWREYNQNKPQADEKISEAEEKVAEAKRTLNSLTQPIYALDTRREIPGAEGYKIYGTVSDIVDDLADVFPIFLYFVAALVTLTTMTRFVDEERINSGTLKALGYKNSDIIKKFVVYGFIPSTLGAIIGIALGHTLLPMIVYNTYKDCFTYPKLEMHFYPGITLVALALAFLSSVVPAYIVANKNLAEKPSQLLQPKAPQAGSKIMLEKIHPIWSRISFTHKVTARNLFRYKKRMLMTIFGVCGSVTLIFAGFSVQNSITGVKDRQFGEIMKYDLIVAENEGLTDSQKSDIANLLFSNDINEEMSIYYEQVSKTAGENNDSQQIKLIVPSNADEISNYIKLTNRTTKESLNLSDDGAIITECLADLLNLKVGDTLEFSDEYSNARSVKVDGITEMYTGHFIFMNKTCYENVYSTKYTTNAYLVTLKDRSSENAKLQASRFIDLSGVKGVVQNTTMTNQIDTIVNSLNRIMDILIAVAMLLAIVILYNLTNINVSERIRELSTIKVLGFHNKEVTMYIYRETILLTILGILAGYAFGDALYLYILKVVPPDDVMFNPALGAKAFIIPVIVVSLITYILGLIINRKLKNVDMLEALKSVE